MINFLLDWLLYPIACVLIVRGDFSQRVKISALILLGAVAVCKIIVKY